ncbi:MAG: hypothetical protein AAF617_07935 [Bacteroidota bacterium]
MKKYIYTVLISALVCLGISCSKDSVATDDTTNTLLTELKKVTTDFIASQDGKIPTSNTKQFNSNEYLVDCEAGMADYIKNGDRDHAIEVGIKASQEAGTDNGLSGQGNAGNPISSVVNPMNGLDYAGRLHAEALEVGYTNYQHQIYPNGVFNYQNATNFVFGYLAQNNVNSTGNTMTESEFTAFTNSVRLRLQQNNYKMSKVVISHKNEGDLTNEEAQILEMYFKAQEQSTTLNGFIQHSIQVENMVVNATNLSASSKELLLFVMATARHDINFWNPY